MMAIKVLTRGILDNNDVGDVRAAHDDASRRGESVSVNGREYKIISIKEQPLSSGDRLMGIISRGFLIIVTLGLALSFRSIRQNLVFAITGKLKVCVVVDKSNRPFYDDDNKIHISPICLFPKSPSVNFINIGDHDVRQIVQVELVGNMYKRSAKPTFDAMLTLARDNKLTSIIAGLHPGSQYDNSYEAFLEYIAGNDESGKPRICSLNEERAFEALLMFTHYHMRVSLAHLDIISQYIGKGNVDRTRIMLDLDPSIIQTINESSFLSSVTDPREKALLIERGAIETAAAAAAE